ncbi:MAG: hypothetical protein OJI67_02340 [Prosthecobacter sp.]|nr:hypothetical protein [Prosthecobacter sp.]
MTDLEFENLLAELADEPPVFTRLHALDLDELEPEKKRRLALFLRSQGKLKIAFAGADSFVAQVINGKRSGESFIQNVMQEQSRRNKPVRKQPTWLPWAIAAAACFVAVSGWWQPTRTPEKTLSSTTPTTPPTHG